MNSSAQSHSDPDAAFRIASWTVEPRLHRVSDGESSRRLEPKVMRVLTCLAARPGELVTRAELMDAVWGDVHVGEDPLNRAIAELRKLFGDRARDPRFIETIPKRGYRLLVAIEWLEAPVKPSGALVWGRSAAALAVVGVLAVVGILAVVAVWLGRVAAPRSADPPSPRRVSPLTSFPGREMGPVLEPDGPRVAFVWRGPSGRSADIWLTQQAGGKPLRLTRHEAQDHQPVWTPDGTEVVFVRSTEAQCEILAVPAIGGPERRLYTCRGKAAVGLDVSPAGDELLVADWDPESATARLVAVDLATGAWRFLTRASGDWSDELPRYSPDGESVVFRRRHGVNESDLFRIPRAGGTAVQLTRDRKDLGGHAWTLDGGSVVFTSNRGGGFELWRLDLAADELVRLGYSNAFLPSIGRRGLVFEQRSGDVDLACVEIAAESPGTPAPEPRTEFEPWGVSTRLDFEPVFAPDGLRVAFVSQRSGSDELWIAEASGTGREAVQLTFFERPSPGWLPAVEHPRFEPGGQRVLIAVHLDDSYDVYAVPSDGGLPERLTWGATDERAPCIPPDGRFLAFVDDRGSGPEIWRLPAGGGHPGQAVRLTKHGAAARLACPAPGTLYYRRPGEARVRRLRLAEDGTVRSDEEVGPAFAGPDWTASAASLYGFLPDDDQSFVLAGYHLGTGRWIRRRTLATGRPAGGVVTAHGGLAVAPDGTTALYARVVGDESDVLLVEGFR